MNLSSTSSNRDGVAGADRRTIKRRHLIYYLRVHNGESGELMGHIVDISTSGIMLMSDGKVDSGLEFPMRANWRNMDQQEEQIKFRAESRWCKRDINPSFYLTGYRLMDVDPEAFSTIQELIRDLGFDD